MGLYLSFPSGWWALVLIVLGIYAVCRKLRKNNHKNEFRDQVIVGFIILIIAGILELVGVSTGLWNYIPGNWPIILPFFYLLSGITAYQLVKLFEEKIKN